jgi:hypothetical protein
MTAAVLFFGRSMNPAFLNASNSQQGIPPPRWAYITASAYSNDLILWTLGELLPNY